MEQDKFIYQKMYQRWHKLMIRQTGPNTFEHPDGSIAIKPEYTKEDFEVGLNGCVQHK